MRLGPGQSPGSLPPASSSREHHGQAPAVQSGAYKLRRDCPLSLSQSVRPFSFFEGLSHQSILVQVPGTGESLSPSAVFAQERPRRRHLPCNFHIHRKVSLLSSAPHPHPPAPLIWEAGFHQPGDRVASGRRMTKRPHAVLLPAGHSPQAWASSP